MAYIFEESQWKLKSASLKFGLGQWVEKQTRPVYLYDLDDVQMRIDAFKKKASHEHSHVHYAMKANSNSRLLELIRQSGLGVDVVSLGEMQKALRVGFEPKKIIFSGVGKTAEELRAAVDQKILQINVESFEELKSLSEIAVARGQIVSVAIRVNIHLEAPTHKNIQTSLEESKFGLDIRLLPEVLQWLKLHPEIALKALAVHIGSQILDVSVFKTMSQKMGQLFREVKAEGFPLTRLDLGGGLGLDYASSGQDDLTRLEAYQTALLAHDSSAEVVLEPGRFLVARMGVLLAQVVYVKQGVSRQFAILNAGMNCLMRPALYQAYHRIEPLIARQGPKIKYDVVGPICESTDIFAEQRELSPLQSGDWVGLFDAGAYGAVMANTYNESPLPQEWTVHNGVIDLT